jgi:hypothetical protein
MYEYEDYYIHLILVEIHIPHHTLSCVDGYARRILPHNGMQSIKATDVA